MGDRSVHLRENSVVRDGCWDESPLFHYNLPVRPGVFGLQEGGEFGFLLDHFQVVVSLIGMAPYAPTAKYILVFFLHLVTSGWFSIAVVGFGTGIVVSEGWLTENRILVVRVVRALD